MKQMPEFDLYLIQCGIADGDEQALKKLYEYYANRLFHFAFTIIHSKELAEEIVEDVFIKIWNKRTTIANIENFNMYLYVAARNISCNYLRKHNKKKVIDLNEVSLPYYYVGATPEELMITSETLSKINQVINDLPPKCRMIFKLVKEDGLKHREVAELLDVSVKTVENQIGIALKKIHASITVYLPQSFRSL
jgi:RNA polymerase sigma-70 factor (family 1)